MMDGELRVVLEYYLGHIKGGGSLAHTH